MGGFAVLPYLINIRSDKDLVDILEKINADKRSFPYFRAKKDTYAIFLRDVDYRAANALKQEMLSRGGDAIVHRNVIQGTIDKSDVVLLGTISSLEKLAKKLEAMPYWGLEKIKGELEKFFQNLAIKGWNIVLGSGKSIELNDNTQIMGILNITPDSFYSTSRAMELDECVKRAFEMKEQGAIILDIGAESSRPGSEPVPAETEKERLLPVIQRLRKEGFDLPISVDTTKSEIAKAALGEGADIINDISAGILDPEILRVAAQEKAPIILMHMKGTPKTMQLNPHYNNLLGELLDFFKERMDAAHKAGVDTNKIILDPGLGFGKTKDHNLMILKNLKAFAGLGRPILIGHSRKSTIGAVLKKDDPKDRLQGTLAITALCAWQDVPIVRVHDVRENYDVVRMINAIKEVK
jgi:dihydropteroate synthase